MIVLSQTIKFVSADQGAGLAPSRLDGIVIPV